MPIITGTFGQNGGTVPLHTLLTVNEHSVLGGFSLDFIRILADLYELVNKLLTNKAHSYSKFSVCVFIR